MRFAQYASSYHFILIIYGSAEMQQLTAKKGTIVNAADWEIKNDIRKRNQCRLEIDLTGFT